MFGKLIGKVLSTPVRLVNIPLKAAQKSLDFMVAEPTRRLKDYDPIALDQVADAIDDACDD
jgi:hypothetical protein